MNRSLAILGISVLGGLHACTFDSSNNGSPLANDATQPDAQLPDAAPPCESVGNPSVAVSESTLILVEGEVEQTYQLSLSSRPCSTVTILVDHSPNNVQVSDFNIPFTIDNWDVPRTISVGAVHDFEREGPDSELLQHRVVSSDQTYDNLAVASVLVSITDRAHVAHVSVGMGGQSADDHSLGAAVSDSGQYVAFTSDADNLVAGGANNKSDIFLRNLVAGTTIRVTNGSGGGGDDDSEKPAISADGQSIAFFSKADNLTVPTYSEGEVFKYQVGGMTTTKVSHLCENCDRNISSATVAIAGNGLTVAYGTRRTIGGIDDDNRYDIFVANGVTTTQASLSTNGQNGTDLNLDSDAFGESLSNTGKFLGFHSAAGNLALPEANGDSFHVYRKDLTNQALVRVSLHTGGMVPCERTGENTFSGNVKLSADGNIAAFESDCAFDIDNGSDTNNNTDIFVRDVLANSTIRVSVSSSGTQANGDSTMVGISDDGNYIAFTSEASNLVPGDNNVDLDLFVHEISTGRTTRVSYDANYGELSNGIENERTSMSRDGKYVVFSTNDNILSSDSNNKTDIYRVQLR